MTGSLDPEVRKKLLLEAKKRAEIRENLEYWATHSIKDYQQEDWPTCEPARHHRFLLDKLSRVATGEIKRLMVCMPRGSAKSTYGSIIFPTWLMATRPKLQVIGASSTADLADDFSTKVQRLMAGHAAELDCKPISERKDLWEASNGSRYRGIGVGGKIVGFRADLIIVDDAFGKREEANSPTNRDKVWGWFTSELFPCLKPSGRVVIINTRWHPDDLTGRLIETQGDKWTLIELPAIWDREEPDVFGRELGDALWPEWMDLEKLEEIKKLMGPLDFAAQMQQKPAPAEGTLFQVGKLGVVEIAPKPKKIVRKWDFAATAKIGSRDPDYTVGLKMQRNADDTYTVLDIVRVRGGPEVVEATVLNTAAMDGKGVEILLPQDPAAAGKIVVNYYTKALAGYVVRANTESGDKATRASPFASQLNAGLVNMVRANWNEAFRAELAMFPGSSHDDQVDAAAGAFAALIDPPKLYRRPSWSTGGHFMR